MLNSFLRKLNKVAITLNLATVSCQVLCDPGRCLYTSSNNFRRLNHSSSKISAMANNDADPTIFTGIPDRYKGIMVKSANNHCVGTEEFTTKLKKSIEKWQKDGVRGLWFHITLEYSFWVPILAKNGFTFHHADGEEVMMTRWLPENEESRIPRYAHTMTGAGAVVVNSRNEILVVSEKVNIVGRSHWKFPGGYIEKGETIIDAAIREVMEETGVKTKFQSLLAFRQSQNATFGCSDMYFIVELIPLSEEIAKCDLEIESCCWMKIEDYINHPEVLDAAKMIAKNYLDCKAAGVCIKGVKTIHNILKRPQTWFTIDLGHEK